MRIALIGGGAREHIIAEKLATEDNELFSLMGKKNPAIAMLSKKYWICDTNNAESVANCLKNEDIDVGFASPDSTLAAGISDVMDKIGILVASPSKAAARLEWDKEFARALMTKHKIRGSPEHKLVAHINDAAKAIKEFGDVAIKPIGLTGGKGVRLSGDHLQNSEDTIAYVNELLRKDGKALIEEKVEGEEFSLQVFSDGTRIATMPPVQDHKRAFEKDLGANTGGMGSYSTGKLLPFIEEKDIEEATKIMQSVVHAMKKDGCPFRGVLYGQFMVCKDGLRLIEFDARFGDPEAMNVLALLETPLADIFLSITDGQLELPQFKDVNTVVKYIVPEGYPDKPVADSPVNVDIEKIEHNGGKVYFASVYEKDGRVYTSSSRAFATLGVSESLEEAEMIAEECCKYVTGKVWHRRDIGTKELIERKVEHVRRLRSG